MPRDGPPGRFSLEGIAIRKRPFSAMHLQNTSLGRGRFEAACGPMEAGIPLGFTHFGFRLVGDAKEESSRSKTAPAFRALAAGLAAILFAAFSASLQAAAPATPDAAGLEFFEKKIRPTLVENCYKCHSTNAEKVKGGFLLDTREGVLKGGDTGPAVVPGDPERSLLIKAVRYADENLQMPPKNKKLSPEQIADLEAWVKMGAPDPRTATQVSSRKALDASRHWAFQPVKQPPVPAVKNRRSVKTPVDAFILAKLEEKKINPSPPADRRTFIRRATFDLLGLPPTPQEAAVFVADKPAEAVTAL